MIAARGSQGSGIWVCSKSLVHPLTSLATLTSSTAVWALLCGALRLTAALVANFSHHAWFFLPFLLYGFCALYFLPPFLSHRTLLVQTVGGEYLSLTYTLRSRFWFSTSSPEDARWVRARLCAGFLTACFGRPWPCLSSPASLF